MSQIIGDVVTLGSAGGGRQYRNIIHWLKYQVVLV
nr:MAG TPA: hypothetical protein [Caudoviricetes sp.]